MDAMTKAPAPMIGGISCPPVEAAASTPPANCGLKPAFFIRGMVITPVDAVLATAEPEIVPVSPLAMTATRPGPPTKRPATVLDILTMKSPAPDFKRNAPNRMNMNTKVDEIPAMLPNRASSPYIDRNINVSGCKPANRKTPGT